MMKRSRAVIFLALAGLVAVIVFFNCLKRKNRNGEEEMPFDGLTLADLKRLRVII
jgi:hypothetical protein